MADLGVVFRSERPIAELQPAVLAGEDAELDEFWLWEGVPEHGGIATTAAALAWTQRIRIGIGVLPVPLRNPVLTAMEIASLAQLFPGRLEAGLGHGEQDWVERLGAGVASPMTLLREYLETVQALLDGTTVDSRGAHLRVDAVQLAHAPGPHRPRVQVGAVGPRTVALAGELGDGLILTGNTSAARVAELRAIYDAARGDRPGRVTVNLMCVPGDDGHERLAEECRRWSVEPAPDVGVAGSGADVATAVRRWVDAGADAVVLQPTDDEDSVGFVRWVGTQVRPRLS